MGDEEDELPQTMCYMETMTKLLERALRQIEDLAEDAAGGATEAQIAEVQRRQTSPDRELLSHVETSERIALLGVRTELKKPC
jgi:hypothetical protein